MKWLLSIAVFIGTTAGAAALMFLIGCVLTPTFDEGSHGMWLPVMLGYLGFIYGLPIAFIAAVVWLLFRIRRERHEEALILAAIDSAGPSPKSPDKEPVQNATNNDGAAPRL